MAGLTVERRTEIAAELRKKAEPIARHNPGQNLWVEYELASNEVPSRDDLRKLEGALYRQFGGYWLAKYEVVYFKTKTKECVALITLHRNPPDDPYPV